MKQPTLISEKENKKIQQDITVMNLKYSSSFQRSAAQIGVSLHLSHSVIKAKRQEDENKTGRPPITISPVSGYDIAIWKNILQIAQSQNFWQRIWNKTGKMHLVPKFFDREMLATPKQDAQIQVYIASTREKRSTVKKGPYWPVVAPDANSYCIYDTDTKTILKSMFQVGKVLARMNRNAANKKAHEKSGGLQGQKSRMRFVIRKPASLGVTF